MSKVQKISKKLKELPATSICGNDISSSVLYVSALSIVYAGKYAWLTLLIVAFILFLFRKIYGEVVGALPLNGGAYNALLNTTSKSTASFAATLTILSYMATAVISADEGINYLHSLFPVFNIIFVTIILLALFAGLTISGIKESSKVAVGIFIFHLLSMTLLMIFISLFLINNGFSVLAQNWNSDIEGGSIMMAVFFGFSASMLGISGFESSANFVEQQEKGVFPKTLRNMWIVVSILNPAMAFFALSIVPIPEIKHTYADTLLTRMAEISGDTWLAYLISLDAVIVLSGAVLTSFVGVSGLLERLTLDRIMPNFFLKKNKKGSSYRIILLFFVLCVSILLITRGKVKILAGVYTISFLSVMALFVVGNVFLKVRREKLPRPERAGWFSLFLAFLAVITAITGNILMEPEDPGQSSNFMVFLDYFIPAALFVSFMLNRTIIMRFFFKFIHYLFDPLRKFVMKIDRYIIRTINKIQSQEFVFFTKGDNLENLNNVMLYIKNNEHTNRIKIVNVCGKEDSNEKLAKDVEILRREYPKINIEFIKYIGTFSPELIQHLSKKWKIPVNFMFIGSPSNKFPYSIGELGGVRLII